MTPVVKYVYLLTLAVWVGSIVFFSFVQAPTVFQTLDTENAARLQRATFPKYYMVGIVCAAVGIGCVAVLLAEQVWPLRVGIFCLLLLAGMGALNVWMRQGVAPQMARVREQRAVAAAGSRELAAAEAEWKQLHGLSVKVNGAVLLGGLVLLGVAVSARVM